MWGSSFAPFSGNAAYDVDLHAPLAKSWELAITSKYNDGFAVNDGVYLAVPVRGNDILIVDPVTGAVRHDLRGMRVAESECFMVDGVVFSTYEHDLVTGTTTSAMTAASGRFRKLRSDGWVLGQAITPKGHTAITSRGTIAVPSCAVTTRTSRWHGVVADGTFHGVESGTDAGKNLVAIEVRSGRPQWRIKNPYRESVKVAGGGIIVSRLRQKGLLRVRDATTGRKLWQHPTRFASDQAWCAAILEGRLTYPDDWSHLTCHGLRSGKPLWRRSALTLSNPVATRDALWCAIQDTRTSPPALMALDPGTGKTRWSTPLKGDVQGIRLTYAGSGRLLLRLGRKLCCYASE